MFSVCIHTCTCLYKSIFKYICFFIFFQCLLMHRSWGHIHVHVRRLLNTCTYILGLGKRFESSTLRLFAMHLKLNFSLQSFAATPTLNFAHAQSERVVETLIENTCKPSNIHLFLLTKLRMLFCNLRPSPNTYIYVYIGKHWYYKQLLSRECLHACNHCVSLSYFPWSCNDTHTKIVIWNFENLNI